MDPEDKGNLFHVLRRSRRRDEAAAETIRHLLRHAEEHYPADSDTSLGAWFARVQETIAVAGRVALDRLHEDRHLDQQEIAIELIGVFGDVCAEAVRAGARAGGGNSVKTSEDLIQVLLGPGGSSPVCPGWSGLFEALLRCSASLEPVATALRHGDLPMDDCTCRESGAADSFSAVAHRSFEVVFGLSR